eukprot:scaffold685076_cov90-Attheya_sp.AAC.1
MPSWIPSTVPSAFPSVTPSGMPSSLPSLRPSEHPSSAPSSSPTSALDAIINVYDIAVNDGACEPQGPVENCPEDSFVRPEGFIPTFGYCCEYSAVSTNQLNAACTLMTVNMNADDDCYYGLASPTRMFIRR